MDHRLVVAALVVECFALLERCGDPGVTIGDIFLGLDALGVELCGIGGQALDGFVEKTGHRLRRREFDALAGVGFFGGALGFEAFRVRFGKKSDGRALRGVFREIGQH